MYLNCAGDSDHLTCPSGRFNSFVISRICMSTLTSAEEIQIRFCFVDYFIFSEDQVQ